MRIKNKLDQAAAKLLASVKDARKSAEEDWRRDHLGASGAGHKCDRQIWLSFRWATNPDHDAQLLRLFDRGHLEEPRFVSELRAAGVTVYETDPDTGEQWRVRWGHVGGSLDGIGIIPWLFDGQRILLEFKTHSEKSFARLLAKKSVKSAKNEHWVQMQVYMLGKGLKFALYVACSKNTDELYYEFVELDEVKAKTALERVKAIAVEPNAPERLDQNYPPCVYTSKEGKRYPCTFFDLCHEQGRPEKSCRTCMECTVVADRTFTCDLGEVKGPIDSEKQREGCSQHITLPGISNAQITDADKDKRRATWTFPNGEKFDEGPDSIPKPEAVKAVCDAVEGRVTKITKASK